jgi:2-polyprenyl-6-methoxyphenol hydroxylase-like FAD-dependent oxidoreductase
MKIIIIGAGIGGLSTYHSLRKHLSEADQSTPSTSLAIKIYESHGSPTSTTSNVGGGLGLAPNGLRAIASVAPGAAEYIQARGYPGAIMSFRNSTGRLLGHFWNGRKERYGFGMLMLRRATVHEALLQDIPSGDINWGKKVLSVHETDDGVRVEFADGSADTGDLAIGADGVRSVVREAMFENKYPAEYECVAQYIRRQTAY